MVTTSHFKTCFHFPSAWLLTYFFQLKLCKGGSSSALLILRLEESLSWDVLGRLDAVITSFLVVTTKLF